MKLTERMRVARSRRSAIVVTVVVCAMAAGALVLGSIRAALVAGGPAACAISGASGATGTTRYAVTNVKGNDSTDDRAGIQSAIDRASSGGGGIVTLPAGTLLVNGPIIVKKKVRLEGLGANTTVVKAGPAFMSSSGPYKGHPLITTSTATDVTIANLTADQSGDTLNGNASGRLAEYLIDIRWSSNALVTGVVTKNPFTYSIAAASSKRFCILNNNVSASTGGLYNQLDGIHILNSSFGDVVGNTIDQGLVPDGDDALVAHTINGSVHDLSYVGNKARGGGIYGHGMQFALSSDTDQIYNITISGNEIWGSPAGIVTGYYGKNGAVHDVAITGNYFHDNSNYAVSITGRPYNVSITANQTCRSQGFTVTPGPGNIVGPHDQYILDSRVGSVGNCPTRGIAQRAHDARVINLELRTIPRGPAYPAPVGGPGSLSRELFPLTGGVRHVRA